MTQEWHEPFTVPDDLSQEERAEHSMAARDATIVHVAAVRAILDANGVKPSDAELTAFAAQTYLEGFRGRVLLKFAKQIVTPPGVVPALTH